MRALIAIALLAGCASAGSSTGSGAARPAVMPMLSELPTDPTKRDAILDSSQSTAGPEQRKGLTRKERKAETAAATAAAILGGMFSSTQNATLGSATMFDENAIAPTPIVPPPPPAASDAEPPTPAPEPPSGDLVPWVKLK